MWAETLSSEEFFRVSFLVARTINSVSFNVRIYWKINHETKYISVNFKVHSINFIQQVVIYSRKTSELLGLKMKTFLLKNIKIKKDYTL